MLAGILVNNHWLETFNHPSETIQGFVVSIFLLGAWVTSYIAPWFMDNWGRRWTIEIGSLVFIVGGILQTVSVTLVQILFGRLIAGFGIGLLSTVVPVYMAELSRAHNVSFMIHGKIEMEVGSFVCVRVCA